MTPPATTRPPFGPSAGRLTLLAALLCCLAAACGGSRKKKVEAPGPVVRKVTIAGANLFSQNDIVDKLAHRPPSGVFRNHYTHLDRPGLRLDERRIANFYRDNGYFRAQVSSTDVIPVPDGVNIRFIINEGTLSRIASIDFKGMPEKLESGARKILDELDLQVGKPFVHTAYVDLKDKLVKILDREGYAYAKVEGTIDVNRDVGSAAIKIEVKPGPLVKLDDTTLEIDSRIPEKSIRARITYDKGDRYHPDTLEQTRRQLSELGFSSVLVDLQREGNPEYADVTIRAKDGKRRELKLGAGLSVSGAFWEVRPRADFTHRGFLHPLLTLRARAQPGYQFLPADKRLLTWRLNTSVTRQDFLMPLLEGTVQGGIARINFDAFVSVSSGGGLSLSRPFFSRHLRLNAGWDLHLIDPEARVEAGLFLPRADGMAGDRVDLGRRTRVAAFQQSITLDIRDNPLSTRKGVFAELKLEEGGPYAGGEVSYRRGQADLRGYLPLGPRLVLAAHGMLGLLRADKSDKAPLTRRFYGGGSSGHRGFAILRLSPFAVSVNAMGELVKRYAVGGEAEFLGTFEVRWDVLPLSDLLTIGLIAFLDAGDVTPTINSLDFGNLHYAPGGGFRLNTSVGLTIRAEAAYRLNRTSLAEPDGTLNPDPVRGWWSRTTLHFTLGQSF